MPVHHVDGVLDILTGDTNQTPLVFDSPHSGTLYPDNNGIIAPLSTLDAGTDLFVHELFGTAANHGAPFLHALFPRMYIDPNRAADDIDPNLIDGAWPTPLNPSEKSERGFGLIRHLALPGVPVYAHPLPVAEIQRRLSLYYWPYHHALSKLIDNRQDQFGSVWHVNCHSMKPVGNAMNTDAGRTRPDIVLGDLEGRSCEPAFTALATKQLENEGLTVAINDPYKGAELTRAYSNPAAGRHSLQIEINRALYLTEEPLQRSGGFRELAAVIDRFCATLADYALDAARSR